ncbi:MAG: hypothetical protein ACPIOQ_69505 [Promethearchaeia archaeon]
MWGAELRLRGASSVAEFASPVKAAAGPPACPSRRAPVPLACLPAAGVRAHSLDSPCLRNRIESSARGDPTHAAHSHPSSPFSPGSAAFRAGQSASAEWGDVDVNLL